MKTTSSQTIYVNDRPREAGEGEALAEVMRAMGMGERKGVAVAVNGTVVPRAEWAARVLTEGDRTLVIQATQGG
jgi:sulfur carrier protein